MITDHVFKPAPFYPDRCDEHAKDAPDRSVICGAPGRDHQSCDGAEGHVSEMVRVTNTTGRPYARCRDCLLYLGPVPDKVLTEGEAEAVRLARSQETVAAVDMRCQKYRDAIGRVMELIRRKPGGMAAKIKQILSEVES